MLKLHWGKALVGAIWLSLIGGLISAMVWSGTPVGAIPKVLHQWIDSSGPFGPIVFLLLFTVRPITLIPASIFCAIAGFLWDPALGIFYTLLGDNLSASFAFWVARLFGRRWFKDTENRMLTGIDSHLREQGFITVLIMRLIYIPFDLVNFGCGLTGMSYGAYAAGTFFGVIPSVVTFVFFGSSWRHQRNLIISAVVFALSLIVARAAKSTQGARAVLKSTTK